MMHSPLTERLHPRALGYAAAKRVLRETLERREARTAAQQAAYDAQMAEAARLFALVDPSAHVLGGLHRHRRNGAQRRSA